MGQPFVAGYVSGVAYSPFTPQNCLFVRISGRNVYLAAGKPSSLWSSRQVISDVNLREKFTPVSGHAMAFGLYQAVA